MNLGTFNFLILTEMFRLNLDCGLTIHSTGMGIGEYGTVVVLGDPDLLGSQDILKATIGQLGGGVELQLDS